MKNKKDLQSDFEVPIYDFRMHLVVTTDVDAWDSKLQVAEGVTTEANIGCEATCVAMPGKEVYIIIRPTSPLSHIAHEIGHASRHIMNYIGFRIESDNDEPLAWLETWLTKKVHDEILSLTKLKSKRKVKSSAIKPE